MLKPNAILHLYFLLFFCTWPSCASLITYNITTFSNIVIPSVGDSVWIQYDLEFDKDIKFNIDFTNHPYFDDQTSTLCANWNSATDYDSSGLSENRLTFSLINSNFSIPNIATVISPTKVLFNMKISNPNTCGTVLISVIPTIGRIENVVLRDIYNNSLRTTIQSNGEPYEGYVSTSDAGIAVECCTRIRKIFENSGRVWDGSLLVEVNLVISDGTYIIHARSSPLNLPISEFYPILPFYYSYLISLELARRTICPSFSLPSQSTLPVSYPSMSSTCARLKPVNSPNSLSNFFESFATRLKPNYVQETTGNRRISVGMVTKVPSRNYSISYEPMAAFFTFPTLFDEDGAINTFAFPVETNYIPQCNLESLQQVNHSFYSYVLNLSNIADNPYQNYLFWIASLITSVDYYSCFQLGKFAVGNSTIGNVLSTTCPSNVNHISGNIGEDACCNTSLNQCCAPRYILGNTLRDISSESVLSLCKNFAQSEFQSNLETTVPCSVYSLNLLKSNLLPLIQSGVVTDRCQFYTINVSSDGPDSNNPIFDQCAQRYFQVNCFGGRYRCYRISPQSVCLTAGYCSVPCNTSSDCFGGVGCDYVEGVKTCLVPPLSDFTNVSAFTECIYNKLTFYERAFLSNIYPHSNDIYSTFSDDILTPQCTGGRIDRTIDFGNNIELNYPGIYASKNWNTQSCTNDFTCNWVYNYPKGANTNPYIDEANCLKNDTYFCGSCFENKTQFCNERSDFNSYCTTYVGPTTIFDCTNFGSTDFNQFSGTTGTCTLPISDQSNCLRSNQCRVHTNDSEIEVCDNSYCAFSGSPCSVTYSDPLPYNSTFMACWDPSITSPQQCGSNSGKWIYDVRQWRYPKLSTQVECESTGICFGLPVQTPQSTLDTLTNETSCEEYTNCVIFNTKIFGYPDLQDFYMWEGISSDECKSRGWCRGRNLFECIHPTVTPVYNSSGKFTCPPDFIPTLELQHCNLDYSKILVLSGISSWKVRNPGMEFLAFWSQTYIDSYTSLCNSYGFDVTWFSDTFPTEESCTSARACVKTSVNGSVQVVDKKNEFDCISCNNNADGDFYNWTSPYFWMPAVFSQGQWTQYKWLPRAINRPYKWANMIDKNRFDEIMRNVSDSLARLQHSASLTCRYAPQLEALQKFTCGCSGSADCISDHFRKSTKSVSFVQPICTNNPPINLPGFGTIYAREVQVDICRLLRISRIKWDQFGWSQVTLSGVDLVPGIQKLISAPGYFPNDNKVVIGNVIGDGFELNLNEPVQQNITLEVLFQDFNVNFPRKFYVTSATSIRLFSVTAGTSQAFDGFVLNTENRISPEDFTANPRITFTIPANTQSLVLFPIVVSEDADTATYVETFGASGQAVIFIGLIFYIVFLAVSVWQFVLHAKATESCLDQWTLPKLAILFMVMVSVVKVIFYSILPSGKFQELPVLGLLIDQLSVLLFFNIATVVVIRWAEIYHYTMTQSKSAGVLQQLFPAAIGISVFLYVFWIATVIAFFVLPTPTDIIDCFSTIIQPQTNPQLIVAQVYRSGFIIFCVALSVAFSFYSYQILQFINESLKMKKNRKVGTTDDQQASAKLRLMLVSIGSILSLIAQACYLIVVVATDDQKTSFDPWRLGLFLILEAIPSIGFILMFKAGGAFGKTKTTAATARSGGTRATRGSVSNRSRGVDNFTSKDGTRGA